MAANRTNIDVYRSEAVGVLGLPLYVASATGRRNLAPRRPAGTVYWRVRRVDAGAPAACADAARQRVFEFRATAPRIGVAASEPYVATTTWATWRHANVGPALDERWEVSAERVPAPRDGAPVLRTTPTVGGYRVGTVQAIESRAFNLTLLKYPAVSFAVWYDTRESDGVVLQFSFNRGQSWSVAGCFGCGSNWYNNAAASGVRAFLGDAGGMRSAAFSGNSGGWQQLDMVNGNANWRTCELETVLRFVFVADGDYASGARAPHRGVMLADFRLHEAAVHTPDT